MDHDLETLRTVLNRMFSRPIAVAFRPDDPNVIEIQHGLVTITQEEGMYVVHRARLITLENTFGFDLCHMKEHQKSDTFVWAAWATAGIVAQMFFLKVVEEVADEEPFKPELN